MTSFSSEDSRPDSCGFVFPEFFLEKLTQLLSYPNSTQRRVEEIPSPPYPTCTYHRSHHVKASPMKGRRIMPILLCFNFVRIWVSAYAALWMNKLLWRGLRGARAKSVGCVWEQGWFIGRTLCCRVAGRISSMWFLLDLHCAWKQQDGLAVSLKNSRDIVSMYSHDWGSTPVMVTGHATGRAWHCR